MEQLSLKRKEWAEPKHIRAIVFAVQNWGFQGEVKGEETGVELEISKAAGQTALLQGEGKMT